MIDWQKYKPPGYDELFAAPAKPRALASSICSHLEQMSGDELKELTLECEDTARAMGITFPLVGETEQALERAWPFDPIPRVLELSEWEELQKGIVQRCKALNAFLQDAYNEQRCCRENLIDRETLTGLAGFRPECLGVTPAHEVWAHVVGNDLVRAPDGQFRVLEDNLRVPSGASYMIENREVMKRVLPETFTDSRVLPIDDYPNLLFETLVSLSGKSRDSCEVVVLTPGIYNSAYYEHAFLARQMGAELVEGRDLKVGTDGYLYMYTIDGLVRIDVIYRRIDDLFLDPAVFREDSVLGTPGLHRAWREGKVALANAPGTGIADDKVICALVPQLIRFYLGEEPLIQSIPTYECGRAEEYALVMDRLAELVIKPRDGSGGKGVVIGPHSSPQEIEALRKRIAARPDDYIAQEVIQLSTCPTLADGSVEPRHVDLRFFALCSEQNLGVPGGLTRVAGQRDSLIVNSSRGGSSKDTWVIDSAQAAVAAGRAA